MKGRYLVIYTKSQKTGLQNLAITVNS